MGEEKFAILNAASSDNPKTAALGAALGGSVTGITAARLANTTFSSARLTTVFGTRDGRGVFALGRQGFPSLPGERTINLGQGWTPYYNTGRIYDAIERGDIFTLNSARIQSNLWGASRRTVYGAEINVIRGTGLYEDAGHLMIPR
jgi:hypothetical protein